MSLKNGWYADRAVGRGRFIFDPGRDTGGGGGGGEGDGQNTIWVPNKSILNPRSYTGGLTGLGSGYTGSGSGGGGLARYGVLTVSGASIPGQVETGTIASPITLDPNNFEDWFSFNNFTSTSQTYGMTLNRSIMNTWVSNVYFAANVNPIVYPAKTIDIFHVEQIYGYAAWAPGWSSKQALHDAWMETTDLRQLADNVWMFDPNEPFAAALYGYFPHYGTWATHKWDTVPDMSYKANPGTWVTRNDSPSPYCPTIPYDPAAGAPAAGLQTKWGLGGKNVTFTSSAERKSSFCIYLFDLSVPGGAFTISQPTPPDPDPLAAGSVNRYTLDIYSTSAELILQASDTSFENTYVSSETDPISTDVITTAWDATGDLFTFDQFGIQ